MKILSIVLFLAFIPFAVLSDETLNESNPMGIYVGAEGHIKYIKDKDRNDRAKVWMPGIGVSTGLKLGEYAGVELGGHFASKKKYSVNYFHKGYSVQVLGYIPIENVSLVGGIGFSHLNIKAKNNSCNKSDSRPIPKASVGFMVHLTDKFATRYMASWEKTSKLGEKHKWELEDSLHHQLGIVYTF